MCKHHSPYYTVTVFGRCPSLKVRKTNLETEPNNTGPHHNTQTSDMELSNYFIWSRLRKEEKYLEVTNEGLKTN